MHFLFKITSSRDIISTLLSVLFVKQHNLFKFDLNDSSENQIQKSIKSVSIC